MNVEKIEGALDALPVTEAYIGAAYGIMAFRFGPYPPEAVGGFLKRLMEEHEGPHPFFFTIQCAPVTDPVPHLLDLARPDSEDEAPIQIPALTTDQEKSVLEIVTSAITKAVPVIVERVREEGRRGRSVR